MWAAFTPGGRSSSPPAAAAALPSGAQQGAGERDMQALHAKLDLVLSSTGKLAAAVHDALARLNRVESALSHERGSYATPCCHSAAAATTTPGGATGGSSGLPTTPAPLFEGRCSGRFTAAAPPGGHRIDDGPASVAAAAAAAAAAELDRPSALAKCASHVISTDVLKSELAQSAAASVADELGAYMSETSTPAGPRLSQRRPSGEAVPIQDRSSITQVASTFGRVLDVTDIHAVLEQDNMLQGMLRDLRPTPEEANTCDAGSGRPRRGLVGQIKARQKTGIKGKRRAGHVSAWLRATMHLPAQQAGLDSEGGQPGRRKHLLPMLHPNGRFRTIWNLAMALLISYSGIVVPMQLAFFADFDRIEWIVLDYIVDFVFLIDICVNLRTGYVTGGHYMDDTWLAARHYLRGGFIVDFAGSFPFNLLESAANSGVPSAPDSSGQQQAGSASRLNRLLRLLRLFKLARMFRLARYMKDLELLQHNPGLMRIAKLALVSLLFCHILGCAWWLVADYERETPDLFGWDAAHVENRWIPEDHLVNGTIGSKWAHSFYWGAGMITSLVPKDVEPVTELECAVTTVAMFTGLILNAFVISALTSAMSSLDSTQAIASEKLEAVRNYLTFKGVGPDLRARIIEFYEYLLTSSQSGEQERALLKDMPPNLSMQLAISVNKRLIKPVPYFATFTDTSLLAIVAKLKPLSELTPPHRPTPRITCAHKTHAHTTAPHQHQNRRQQAPTQPAPHASASPGAEQTGDAPPFPRPARLPPCCLQSSCPRRW